MSLYDFEVLLAVKVIECTSQTLTVKGVPFWYTFTPGKWIIAGTDINIIDYIGDSNIGLLYIDRPIVVNPGTYINLTTIK